jgi:hypothetical protein
MLTWLAWGLFGNRFVIISFIGDDIFLGFVVSFIFSCILGYGIACYGRRRDCEPFWLAWILATIFPVICMIVFMVHTPNRSLEDNKN